MFIDTTHNTQTPKSIYDFVRKILIFKLEVYPYIALKF